MIARLLLCAFVTSLTACSTSHGPSAAASAAFASAGCSTLDSTDGAIVDSAGAIWTLVRDDEGALVVDLDGAPAGFTDWVQRLVYVEGVVSHENLSGQWYAWSGSGWSAEADPTAACDRGATPSADCTLLHAPGGTIVDGAGNVWMLAGDGNGGLVVDDNGAPAGFTANVATLAYVGGVVSHENESGNWYAWSGSGWLAEGDPTVACTTSGGGGGSGASGDALFFDGFDTLDVAFDGSASTWMDHYPFGGSEFTLAWNNEAEYLCDAGRDGYQPFSVADGILTIAATTAATSGRANPGGLPWSSGTLTSCAEVNGEPAPGLFAHTYGYFEMRAQLPAGTGFWPAFVLYPLSGAGEIDIFEVLGNDPTTLYFTLHASSGGGQQVLAVADVSQDFHTYGCDWQPDFITLYIDGVKKAAMPTPSDMIGKPYYINIPFSVGGDGSWPGPTTSATPDPGLFRIDYVGVWSDFAAAHP